MLKISLFLSGGDWSLAAPTCRRMGEILQEANRIGEAITVSFSGHSRSKGFSKWVNHIAIGMETISARKVE